ncbi:MAG: hypothetical protein EPO24_15415, partial [Bacteroidetes bacterium]
MKHLITSSIILSVLVLSCFASTANAQTTVTKWQHLNGPYGGMVTALHYAANGNLLAGTLHGGIYRSVNNGGRWSLTNATNTDIRAFATAANGTLYAGSSEGIYISFDHGSFWYQPDNTFRATVLSLFINSKGVIFAGTTEGLYISSDDGRTWELQSSQLAGLSVRAIKKSASNDLYAGTDNGVYLSDSAGFNWFNIGMAGTIVNDLALVTPNIIVAATNNSGIYRSSDNGANWYSVALAGIQVNALIAGSNDTLYAGATLNGTYISVDAGSSWAPAGLASVSVLALNAQSATEIQAGTGVGFYSTTNSGTNWKQLNSGLRATFVNQVAIDTEGNLYAATENQGLYRSTNEGEVWLDLYGPLPAGSFRALTVSSTGVIFAGHESSGLFRSWDSGNIWEPVGGGLSGYSIQTLVSHDNYVYAGTADAGFFSTFNDGASWIQSNPPVGSMTVLAMGADPQGNIYASFAGYGVFYSSDHGANWQDRNNGLSSMYITAFGFDSSGMVYAADGISSELFSSANNGLFWTPTGLNQMVSSIATTPTGAIFAATKDAGVFKSTDGAASWNLYNSGLPYTIVNHITLTRSGAMYASTQGGGVYRSTYRFFGSISGVKFFDQNRNRVRDVNEIGLPNWQIISTPITTNVIDSLIANADTTMTDSSGSYSFDNLIDGKYLVFEIQQDGWVKTFPRGRGYYILTIENHEAIFEIDFGNTLSHRFAGTAGSNWSNPSNWPGGRVPTDTDAVEIPVEVFYDQPGTGIIHSLRVGNGGRFHFSPSSGQLVINNSLEIDSGSTLSFDVGDSGKALFVNGDWINDGTFDAGMSTIVFSGTGAQTISNGVSSENSFARMRSPSSVRVSGGQFWDLQIAGDSISTDGNVIVENYLTLQKPLYLNSNDTLSLLRVTSDAILDTGNVSEGTIQRYIDVANGGTYRFESPKTTVEFSASGSNPTSVLMTAFPSTHPDTTTLWFERMGGTINTDSNIITVDSVEHFSKWVFGKPGAGFRKATGSTSNFERAYAARYYAINADGGGNFSATVKLRYEESDLDCIGCEGELELLRGPYIIDTVYEKWNLLSPPLVTESANKDSLFPNSSSFAFSYDGAYTPQDNLSFGTGYWLKFGSNQTIAIIGDDVDSVTIPILEGWNLIGAASLPVDPLTVTSSPEEIVSGSFFDYRNGYKIADVLQPMHGYWVRASSDGELTLNAGNAPQAKRASIREELSLLNVLTIRDAYNAEQVLYFGSGGINPEKYEMPPAPPQGIFDARFSSNLLVELVDYGKTKETLINISSARY